MTKGKRTHFRAWNRSKGFLWSQWSWSRQQVWGRFSLHQERHPKSVASEHRRTETSTWKSLPLSQGYDLIVAFEKLQKEQGTTLYLCLFIAHAVALCGVKGKATPEYDLRSQHKNGSVDYSILSTTDDKLVLGVIEVKYRDVQSGITQNAFQLHAALMNRNRKFDGAHK